MTYRLRYLFWVFTFKINHKILTLLNPFVYCNTLLEFLFSFYQRIQISFKVQILNELYFDHQRWSKLHCWASFLFWLSCLLYSPIQFRKSPSSWYHKCQTIWIKKLLATLEQVMIDLGFEQNFLWIFRCLGHIAKCFKFDYRVPTNDWAFFHSFQSYHGFRWCVLCNLKECWLMIGRFGNAFASGGWLEWQIRFYNWMCPCVRLVCGGRNQSCWRKGRSIALEGLRRTICSFGFVFRLGFSGLVEFVDCSYGLLLLDLI